MAQVYSMAGGAATRLSPLTWYRTKALIPVVGHRMMSRIIYELYKPQDFKNIGIVTCILGHQIDKYVRKSGFEKGGLEVSYYPNPYGEAEKALSKINTAHSVLIAHKKAFGIDIGNADYFIKETNFDSKPIGNLVLAFKKMEINPKIWEEATLAIANLRPLNKGKGNGEFKPFVVTGCDALTNGDLRAIFEELLNSERIATINLYPMFDPVEVINYGIVMIKDGKAIDFKEKPGEAELKRNPSLADYKSRIKLNGEETECFLVNPQLYAFDPSVLAIIEAFVNAGLSPDWGKQILPLLAKSGMLFTRTMSPVEKWVDIGDLGTLRLTATREILYRNETYGISIPGEKHGGVWREVGARVDASVDGRLFAGSGSLIREGAKINFVINPKEEIGTVVEDDAVIEKGAEVSGSIIYENAVIKSGARVKNSIIGRNVIIPEGAEIEGEVVETVGFEHGRPVQIIVSTKIPMENGKPLNIEPKLPTRRFF